VGKRADLVLLRSQAPNLCPVTPENVVSGVVYSAHAGNVRTVICDGKILMLDRQVLTLPEAQVALEAEEAASDLLDRAR